MNVASAIALALLVGAQGRIPQARRPAPEKVVYPFEVAPHDALWGHLEQGAFREPTHVCFEPHAGELYVADSKNGLIGIFDAEGTPLFAFGGGDTLIEPSHVLAMEDGAIYALDAARSGIQRFDYRGQATGALRLTRPTPRGDALIVPRSFARGPDGRWYVGDRDTQRVFVFTPDASYERELPPPIGATHFEVISDIAVSSQGLVAVIDQRGTPAIHVYDGGGALIAAFGKHDIGLDNFTSPIAVEFDEQGFLFAVDLLRHDVKIFTPDGKFLGRFGGWFSPQTRGRAPGELLYPTGIAIAPDGGAIYVAERFGQRVQIFRRTARPSREPTPSPPPASKP